MKPRIANTEAADVKEMSIAIDAIEQYLEGPIETLLLIHVKVASIARDP